jgi:hypothetical protein
MKRDSGDLGEILIFVTVAMASRGLDCTAGF